MNMVPINLIISVASRPIRPGRVRPAKPDETPDFVQKRDKLCTAMIGIRQRDGEAFSLKFDPPVMLQGEVPYMIELGPQPPFPSKEPTR